ncbi:hypothetical protein PGAG_00118 [Phaeocystis globosa virus 12T]|uniref:Uncharacterized protein n=1 Tax=Phaeocystis globosa virus PgV-16T TaxID=3071227 RepID=A0AC59EWZ3_9VIRU|nr:hypothetical protein PGCG_00159 [Phaeocystis globosa virus]AET73007.1 hypothetical protein PGAG_00118 [Phaeocystis globosa virus 12T]AET73829.1 hypothetical protein PGBG_00121 [Phaeocystis globosa virus 14T]AGM15470.1 hypothetical protein PGCG_00159 [Phaeocystis globosa virus PgV-16T]UYE94200.1 hypothetical protein PGV14T_00159 [Phaeocystis globosa virus]
MGQNYFYNLPDDIIDMIMFEAHKVSFKQTLNIIGYARITSAIMGSDYMREPANEDYWVGYENNEEPYAEWVAQTVETFRRMCIGSLAEIYMYNVVRNLMADVGYPYTEETAFKSKICFNLMPFIKIFSKLYARREKVNRELDMVGRAAGDLVKGEGVRKVMIAMAMARASWADMMQQEARHEARCAISLEKRARQERKDKGWTVDDMEDHIVNMRKLDRQDAQWVLVEAMKVNRIEARTLNLVSV